MSQSGILVDSPMETEVCMVGNSICIDIDIDIDMIKYQSYLGKSFSGITGMLLSGSGSLDKMQRNAAIESNSHSQKV